MACDWLEVYGGTENFYVLIDLPKQLGQRDGWPRRKFGGEPDRVKATSGAGG
jgi:hypothetical protein